MGVPSSAYTSHLLIQMLAPAYQLLAHDQLAPAYQLSVLDNSQVIADQTFELSIFFSPASLGDALYRTAVATAAGLSSAASERPANELQNFLGDDTAASDPGRAGGPGCDATFQVATHHRRRARGWRPKSS